MATINRIPIVGVVTVTFGSGGVLDDFLDSLAAQEGVTIRLYGVDNDSKDDSVARLRAEQRLQHVEVIANDANLGVAVGNNQGIEAALRDRCDWILLLNNDTMFGPSMIARLVSDAESRALDLVSPVIEATDPADTVWYAGGRIRGVSMVTRHLGVGRPMSSVRAGVRRTGYASTCCLLVRPQVFQRIGLMDPLYFVYFDDVDFAARALKAGYQYWLDSDARLTHKASSLTGGKQSTFTVSWTARNWPLMVRRHRRGAALALGLAYVQLWIVGRFILRRDRFSDFALRQSRFRDAMRVKLVEPPRVAV
ncbi:glycosyltransferase family 2 protein [uncultured Amnibacterium sp.]|uniref:glycosyltransferase family 2 protein n=1 Tax=uncultured Amnibacterium sp. TaxID=1631851 RepID=UPI0035C9F324